MRPAVPAPAAGVLSRDIDDDVTIYRPEDHTAQVLNHTAGAIWRLLDGQRSIDEIVVAVAGEYGVAADTIRTDVADTIERFRRDGLLADSARDEPETSVRFDLAGTVIALSVPDGSTAERLHHLLPAVADDRGATLPTAHSYRVRPATEPGLWHLVRDGDRLVESRRLYVIEKRLVADLNRLVRDATPAFSVHAGAVADDGAVIAFPGESGRGKSTLVAACVGAGLDYVSDEALLVDHETATVVPYPKPIQLDARSLQLLGRAELADNRDDDEDDVFVSAQSIGGAAATTDPPLRLRHVVVPTVDAATGTPELRPLSRSHILVALLRASFNHHLAPEQAFDLVHRLADGARAWKLRIGDPNEAAELIATQLARPGPAAGSAP